MVDQQTIIALRGLVDFYYWKSIPVARAWPRYPRQPHTPEQVQSRNAMREAFAWLRTNPAAYHENFRTVSTPSVKSYVDVERTAALTLAHRGALVPPPVVTAAGVHHDDDSNRDVITFDVQPYEGFDPDAILLALRPYISNPPPVEYIDREPSCKRTKDNRRKQVAVLSKFSAPLTTSYDPGAARYTLTRPGTM